MKTRLLLFVMVFSGIQAIAQTWCPPGATWHFSKGGYIGDMGYQGVIEVTYTANATMAGIPCKRLDAVFKGRNPFYGPGTISAPYSTYYTYSNNNVIYIYNNTSFDTLVDFNAVPGDKWLGSATFGYCLKTPVVTVTDTSHITINGFYLKQIKTIDTSIVMGYTAQNTPSVTFSSARTRTYTERLLFTTGGLESFFFPTACPPGPYTVFDGPPASSFRCYHDDAFPTYNVSTVNCDYSTGIGDVAGNNIKLSVYPNPNSGSFELEIEQATDIAITNMLGELVYKTSYPWPGKVNVATANIKPGVYIMSATTADGNGELKFIVE